MRLSPDNKLSIYVELVGCLLLIVGIILEYIMKADGIFFLISCGSLVFSVGSGLVKKFPWAYIIKPEEANRGTQQESRRCATMLDARM